MKREPLKLHNRPRDGSECKYLPITTENGSEFCTKCGWVGIGGDVSYPVVPGIYLPFDGQGGPT